jgi:hypothetical protein
MIRFAAVILCTIITLSSLAAKKIPGTIIFRIGEEKEVTFEIPTVLMGSINYIKLQEKVRYFDAAGKRVVLKPDQAKEILFSYEGENIRMISIPRSGNLMTGSIFSSSMNIFLKLEAEGKLRVFYFEYRQSSPGMMGPNGMMTGGVSSKNDRYLFQKNGGSLKQPRGLAFRKDMLEYFSDCPKLAEQIDKKEFGRDDMLAIAKFYNSSCK